jgi:hypothetical protein
MYGNSVQSIFIYSRADTSPPAYATPATASVYCRSSVDEFRQYVPSGVEVSGDVWLGAVSWVTEPLAEDLTIQGNVNMTVWLSASDDAVSESGYIFGMAEFDVPTLSVGDSFYQYRHGSGNTIGTQMSAHALTFNVDRTFSKDKIIAFFVIVESTEEGWPFQVYFDSPSVNSFASLPMLGVPIPEFNGLGATVVASLMLISCSFLFRRRR